MTNEQVIRLFLRGENAKTNKRQIAESDKFGGTHIGYTLISNDNILTNFNTPIATIITNTVYLDINKYSATTSTIQNKLRKLATQQGYKIIECLEIISKEVM